MPPWTGADITLTSQKLSQRTHVTNKSSSILISSGADCHANEEIGQQLADTHLGSKSESRALGLMAKTSPNQQPRPKNRQRPLDPRARAASAWPLTSLTLCFIVWKVILLTIAVTSPGPSYDTSTKLLLAEHQHDYVGSPSTLQSVAVSSTAADVMDPLDLAWYIDTRGDRQPYGYMASAGLESVDPLHFGFDELSARLALRLIKWDAIYYVSAGKRGRIFEQEWAFGWGWGQAIQSLSERIHLFDDPLFNVAYVGIIISNTSHLLSVIVLYYITLVVAPPTTQQKRQRLAFITAALHIASPASFFLVAPYAEASFSLLSFMGHLLFAKSTTDDKTRSALHDLWLLLSGVFFGLSVLVRSNGVINGLIPFVSMLLQLWRFPHVHFRKLVCTILSGLFIAVGMLYPQYLAYLEFCTDNDQTIIDGVPPVQAPAWCRFTLPSITAHVQSRYWNVGFLRYWIPSNIGLFAIAAPTLGLLGASAFDALRGRLYSDQLSSDADAVDTSESEVPASERIAKSNNRRGVGRPRPGLLRTVSNTVTSIWKRVTDDSDATAAFVPAAFALQQLLLAFLALTTFHVQIITRLASGSPLWYLWLGGLVADSAASSASRQTSDDAGKPLDGSLQDTAEENYTGYTSNVSESFVRYMVCYGLVQGALFAAFLPPA